MKDVDEDFSELVVLPAIDDDVHAGVQDKEEVGKVGENSAPEDTNIYQIFTFNLNNALSFLVAIGLSAVRAPPWCCRGCQANGVAPYALEFCQYCFQYLNLFCMGVLTQCLLQEQDITYKYRFQE